VALNFVVDGTHAYMTNPEDPNDPNPSSGGPNPYTRVVRLDLQTGSAVQIFNEPRRFPLDPNVPGYAYILAIDDQWVYMETDRGLVRVAK
jgi:hypothetical protein